MQNIIFVYFTYYLILPTYYTKNKYWNLHFIITQRVMKRIKKTTEVEAAIMVAPLGAVMKLIISQKFWLSTGIYLQRRRKKYYSSKSFTDHYNITFHIPGCGSLLKQVL